MFRLNEQSAYDINALQVGALLAAPFPGNVGATGGRPTMDPLSNP